MSTFDVSQVRRPVTAPSKLPKIALAVVAVAAAFGLAFAAGKATSSGTPAAPAPRVIHQKVTIPQPAKPSLADASALPGLQVVKPKPKPKPKPAVHAQTTTPVQPVTPTAPTTPHYSAPAPTTRAPAPAPKPAPQKPSSGGGGHTSI